MDCSDGTVEEGSLPTKQVVKKLKKKREVIYESDKRSIQSSLKKKGAAHNEYKIIRPTTYRGPKPALVNVFLSPSPVMEAQE